MILPFSLPSPAPTHAHTHKQISHMCRTHVARVRLMQSDLGILNDVKEKLKPRNTVTHNATVMAHAIMHR